MFRYDESMHNFFLNSLKLKLVRPRNARWITAVPQHHSSTTTLLHLRALSAQLSANIKSYKPEAEKNIDKFLKDRALVPKTVSNTVI